ncbi:hypothetical protein ABTY61_32820 [Kitasatospora sp. NPDC096128]|uniref:hypothetical protein n=1 Tax=Kitasatospora sp. NPDC096128 TaxID=3155547 RepID=UPI003323D87F
MRFVIILISSVQIAVALAAAVKKKRSDSYPSWYPMALMAMCGGLLLALAAEQWL